MDSLLSKKCVPCEGGTPVLTKDEIAHLMGQLKTRWFVFDQKKLRKEFQFKYFTESILFVNKVAHVAEEEGHHPDIHIFYNKVIIELWTHAIGGLSENDFIVAAKIEEIT